MNNQDKIKSEEKSRMDRLAAGEMLTIKEATSGSEIYKDAFIEIVSDLPVNEKSEIMAALRDELSELMDNRDPAGQLSDWLQSIFVQREMLSATVALLVFDAFEHIFNINYFDWVDLLGALVFGPLVGFVFKKYLQKKYGPTGTYGLDSTRAEKILEILDTLENQNIGEITDSQEDQLESN